MGHPDREVTLIPETGLEGGRKTVCDSYNFFFNVYLFLTERERQSMSVGGAEREGATESEGGSRL